MSLHKSLRRALTPSPPSPERSPWLFPYPNTADFNFNYYHLLDNASSSAIGRNVNPAVRIAIVGSGVAGLVAARELFRSGYVNIDIYEASERVGGRNYSIPAPGQYTAFEMGAMRMPFFSAPGSHNCVLDYYCSQFRITTQPFPDPGSDAVATTGIYMNNGLGPDPSHPYPEPRLDIWQKDQPPPSPALQKILAKWEAFANMFEGACGQYYATAGWTKFWDQVVQTYWTINFRDLVYMPALAAWDPSNPGNFGGLGMTEDEGWNFYVIGAGDGGWGAFYDISALYPIRTLLFGYSTNHQLVQGCFDANGEFAPGPHYGEPVRDSLGNPLVSPQYLGLQSVAESLFYEPVNTQSGLDMSLYQASLDLPGINLYMRNPVTRIQREADGVIHITSPERQTAYDQVVVTAPNWALDMSTIMQGFDYSLLPYMVSLGLKESHWITSCKIFYPLKERYWENSRIPQVINTDTFLQDVYGIAVSVGSVNDPGVLLLSYTWEDDATKLGATSDDAALASKCLEELDRVLVGCGNIGVPISPFVDASMPVVIHWERQPTYRGCAKLYRERSWPLDYALLTYNQSLSGVSGLYFAGEAYSVEGGWTEPALRTSLDAVVHLIRNTGGEFLNGFDYARDYPRYQAWSPQTTLTTSA